MKLYLDDERPTPSGWDRAYTVQKCIDFLQTRIVTHLSLDNDLGEGQPEGFKVLDWLEEIVYDEPNFPMPEVTIHSANPVRRQHMLQTLQSIQRIQK